MGPLTTMLVMDVSGSMDKDGKIDGARTAAKAYVDQMRSGDQAGLLVYNTKYEYVQPITQDRDALKSAIDGIKTGGDTAMYDALFAAEEILRDVQGRKAIIAVTDGLDNSSSHNAGRHHHRRSARADSPSRPSVWAMPRRQEQRGLDEAGLQSLAQRAGGGYSFAGDAAALSALFQSYGRELQNEYAITYTSPSTLRDGVNRDLTVSIAGAARHRAIEVQPGRRAAGGCGRIPGCCLAGLLIGLLALLVVPLLLNLGGRSSRRRPKEEPHQVGGSNWVGFVHRTDGAGTHQDEVTREEHRLLKEPVLLI